jgi:hypothetical protein
LGVFPDGLAERLQAADRLRVASFYSTLRTFAHTAIIPMKSTIDVSAAASSIMVRNIASLLFEHRGNIVHDMFYCNGIFAIQRSRSGHG